MFKKCTIKISYKKKNNNNNNNNDKEDSEDQTIFSIG